MPSLIIYPRHGDGFSFALPDAKIGIGRSPTNSLVLADMYCSLYHASVYPVLGEYAIQDLGSMNGTWVNARRIEKETELHPGDEIMVGETHISFAAGEGRRPYSSEHTWAPQKLEARGGTTVALVDNRVFVLGLNEFYRDEMKQFESSRLLQSARAVASALHVMPGLFPIEGYYADTPKLKEYFSLMRTLQELDKTGEDKIRDLPEFQFLTKVTRSPLFGRTEEDDKLLPRAIDPLGQALNDCAPIWNLDRLVKSAYKAAFRHNDCSLVGLAARTQDAVVLTATRESTALYAEVMLLGISMEPQVKYEWAVDDSLAEAANHFIDAFNDFVPGALPKASAANARGFYKSYANSEFIGRCVKIGMTPDRKRHYHWAIAVIGNEQHSRVLGVDEFWSGAIWTTDKYRQAQGDPAHMRLFAKAGVPET